MGSFSTCEISEEMEEQDYADRKIYGVKEGKLPLLTEALEDDISKLFKSFNLRNSSRIASSSYQASPGALMKKKPITVPHSPGIGSSRTVSLKQALRDLSLSKASEMAALRRLSKSSSEGTSKAVNIKNLYDTKIAKGSESGSSSREAKEPVLEISVVRGSNSNSSVPNELPRAELIKKDKQVASPLSLSNSFKGKVKNKKAQKPEKKTAKHYSTTDGIKDEKILGSTPVVVKTKELLEQQENIPTSTTSLPGLNDMSESQSNVPVLNKPVSRSKAVSKTGQRSDILGKLPRNTTTTKKKVKQDLVSAASYPDDFVGTAHLDPSVSNLVCKKCLCSLQSEPKLKVSSSCSESSKLDVSPESQTNSSSKHSLRDYSSTTTSLSDESNNLSRSSCSNRPHMSKDVRWEAIRYVRRQHGVKCLNLRHFSILTKLGGGDIGTVYLAELIGTNCLFAIKVMDNEYLALREKIQRVQTEREILYVLDHPFLPTLYSQFKSDSLSCLVMEYCPGGDLHVLRQNQLGSRFSEPAARFYVAEVLLALEYLHMLGIIYRDLKPENVLVREDGHIMLTDFDLSLRCIASPTLLQSPRLADPARVSESNPSSCRVPCFTPWSQPQNTAHKVKVLKPDHSKLLLPQLVVEPTSARSNSFVGTYEYLAPEIVKGEGHGAAVDWWTFGVFLYELLYGRTPFRGSGNEETLTNVVLRDLQFPNLPRVSVEARDIIGRLLVKDPERRLGAEKGAAEIKQHPFFEGVNWALIRCSIPPQLPEPYEYGVGDVAAAPAPAPSKYLEFKGTGEKVEFELF